MAYWIWMPFEVVTGVGQWMCVRWGWRLSKGRGSFRVNVEHSVVTSGEFVVYLCENA